MYLAVNININKKQPQLQLIRFIHKNELVDE